LLTSFGTFWAAEGAGVAWPGDDVALLVIVCVMTGAALVLTAGMRSVRGHDGPLPPEPGHPVQVRP
jgi:uncharacterized membrane protein